MPKYLRSGPIGAWPFILSWWLEVQNRIKKNTVASLRAGGGGGETDDNAYVRWAQCNLRDREFLEVSGVRHVESFDDKSVV